MHQDKIVNEVRKKRLTAKYVFRRVCTIAVVLTLFYGCVLIPAYRDYGITVGLSNETVTSITFLPNGDWSPITLDASDDIDAFVEWLGLTRHQGRGRSAPPPCIYPGVIQLKGGGSESFRMSAAMDAWTPAFRDEVLSELSDSRDYDEFYRTIEQMESHEPPIYGPRGDIVIWIRGRRRSGSREVLEDLLGLELPPASTETLTLGSTP